MWSATQMFCGGLCLLGVACATGEVARWPLIRFDATASWAVLYLIIAGSWLGYGSYAWLLERVSPGKLSTYAFVNPAVAILLGAWLLDEPVTAALGVGALLILSGVVLVQLPARSIQTAARGAAAQSRRSSGL
jgi:drug/metabolite transporter (DMT)-like permease